MIIKSFKDGTQTEYEVEIVSRARDGFQFKAIQFPPPEMGRRFVLDDGIEVEITEQRMEVENNRAMYYFWATHL